jgi:hypothetical protein
MPRRRPRRRRNDHDETSGNLAKRGPQELADLKRTVDVRLNEGPQAEGNIVGHGIEQQPTIDGPGSNAKAGGDSPDPVRTVKNRADDAEKIGTH